MRLTRITWLAGIAGATAFVLGCGEGRVIFNVDVLSYRPDLADTVPYVVPGGSSITGVRDSFELALPGGLGHSTVDSVILSYGSTILNAAGSGKFKLEVFFSSDPAAIFTSPISHADSVTVLGPDTLPIGPISVPLLGGDSLFNKDRLWVGVRGSVVANSNMSGRVVTVSTLRLRLVLQDRLLQ